MTGSLGFDLTPYVAVYLPASGSVHKFVVDTGFTGSLYLPEDKIAAWNLPFLSSIPVVLANQTTIITDAYECTVVWFGRSFLVSVLAGPSGCDSLIGMELLEGHRIELDTAAGEVRIDQL